MSSVRTHPIVRHTFSAAVFLSGAYLIGRKTSHPSSLLLVSGVSLSVSILTNDYSHFCLLVKMTLLILAALGAAYMTKKTLLPKQFTPLPYSYTLMVSIGIGLSHFLIHTKLRSSARHLYSQADILFNEKKFPEAEIAYRSAIEVFRNFRISNRFVVQAKTSLGISLAKQKKFQEAEEAYRSSIATCKKHNISSDLLAPAQASLGRALFHQNKFSEAEVAFRSSIATSKNSELPKGFLFNVQSELGLALAKQNKFPQAEEAYRLAIATSKNSDISDKFLIRLQTELNVVLEKQGKPLETLEEREG